MLRIASLTVLIATAACSAQTPPSRPPAPAVMPNFIEEFFLADAVRSENRNELQLIFASALYRRGQQNVGLSLEYGITNRLQFSTEIPYGLRGVPALEPPQGWSSVALGGQYQILRSGRPFALSAALLANVPVRSGADLEWEPELLIARQFRNTQLHANIVAETSEEGTQMTYNAAAVHHLSTHWRPTLELSLHRGPAANTLNASTGLYYHVNRYAEFGAAAVGGIHPGAVFKITFQVGDADD